MRTARLSVLAAAAFLATPTEGALPPAAQFNFREPARQSLPEWVMGLGQTDGRFTVNPASWTVDAAAPPDTGTLSVQFDRATFSEDLAVGVIRTGRPDLRWTAQLWDDSGRVVARDLVTNYVCRTAEMDAFIVPLSKYRSAQKLVLLRMTGEMTVHAILLQPLPLRMRSDAPTQADVAERFAGTTVTALRQALAIARGELPPTGSTSVPRSPNPGSIREGPQFIDAPRDGERVPRSIPMSGRAPRIPEGHRLYVFQSMGADFWPKGEDLVVVDGRWQTVVKHGGHAEASFALGLYAVSPEAHARFQDWRAEAKRTGKYPPIKGTDMTGTVPLSHVRVKVRPD